MNKLSESRRYYTSKNFRMTETIEKLLKARAIEDECSESDVVRRALTLYLTTAKETQLIHSSLVDSKRKISTLDKKVETIAVVLYKLAHEFFRQHPELPNTASKETFERIADRRFDQFTQECAAELQSRHGLVESLILSVYQKETN